MIELNRRAFLSRQAGSLGQIALGSLMLGGTAAAKSTSPLGLAALPHFAPKAKRVIYLFQSGGPSHCDLFDYSPVIDKLQGTELPASIRGDQRVTGMTSEQGSYPVVAPMWGMQRCGERGTWISDLLPHTQKIADKIAIVRSVHTEAINHDPAVTFINTGSQQPGNASMGAWLSYGLGSENENLPAYTVLMSQGSGKNPGQPLFSRLWGSGFLPSNHQGVNLRPGANPVLYLANPEGVTPASRRAMLDDLAKLNGLQSQATGDPEIQSRVAAYEMAFRMQTSVPDLTDLSDESESTFELYGPEARRPGSFAANCLLARRMAERGVRFIQLFHRGWDQHFGIKQQLPKQCQDTDQPSAALITDLHERGLLDDTLVIWGGEFGRTVYSQGELGSPQAGRDHHGRCFSIWMAGGGIKPGIDFGQTDDFCYNITENPVHVNDLNATILHCLGINHERFTFKFRGLDQRLTGVEESRVVHELLT